MMKPVPTFNLDDIQFPSFGANALAADDEFDFNILSEYLLDDDTHTTGYTNRGGQSAVSKSASDLSDKDGNIMNLLYDSSLRK